MQLICCIMYLHLPAFLKTVLPRHVLQIKQGGIKALHREGGGGALSWRNLGMIYFAILNPPNSQDATGDEMTFKSNSMFNLSFAVFSQLYQNIIGEYFHSFLLLVLSPAFSVATDLEGGSTREKQMHSNPATYFHSLLFPPINSPSRVDIHQHTVMVQMLK